MVQAYSNDDRLKAYELHSDFARIIENEKKINKQKVEAYRKAYIEQSEKGYVEMGSINLDEANSAIHTINDCDLNNKLYK